MIELEESALVTARGDGPRFAAIRSIAVPLALAMLLAAAAPARADVAIDVPHRTVTTSRLALQFGTDPERLDSLVWTDSNGHRSANLAASSGASYCGDALEFWGQSYGATEGLRPYVVVGGSGGTWSSPAPGQVQIRSRSADGCGDPVPVTTTYTFYDDGAQANEVRVERRIGFDVQPLAVAGQPGLRLYVPRLPVGVYNRLLHPDSQGNVVAEGVCDNCAPRFGSTWFADDSVAGSGLLVLRDATDDPSAQLEPNVDAYSASNGTAFELPQPTGGYSHAVDEVEYLCFYDAVSWPADARRPGAPATLPAGCGPAPATQGPSVTNQHVLGVGTTSATVGADVDPGGEAATYRVQWGATSAYGSSGPELGLDGAGPRAVAAQLTGLAPGTTYHWRILAGSAAGPDATLTTATTAPGPGPTPTPPPPAPPVARISVTPARTPLLSAAGSTPAGSPIVSVAWDLTGSGAYTSTCSGTDMLVAPGYARAGTYRVGLRVTAANGASSTSSQSVTVSHVPPSGGSGLTGYACGSLVGNALCTHHIVWRGLVADALDNGCFDPVTVKGMPAGTIIGTAAQAGANIAVPPSVADWFQLRDAQNYRADGRVLINGVILTPRPFTVTVSGRRSTLPGFVLIGETTNSIFSYSADAALAPPPGGQLPATPLARAQPIRAHFSGAALAQAAEQPAGYTCEDPAVRTAPQLASFPDPAQSGVSSAVDGFKLAGGSVVHVVDGTVVVCVNITLPGLVPCADSAGGFVLRATLVADQTGLRLNDLHAGLGCAVIAGVVFEDVVFDYDAAGRHWKAAGSVEAIPGIKLHGEIEFAHGDFQHAAVRLGNDALVVPPWQLAKAEVDVYPDRTTGAVRLSLYPAIPALHASLLDLDGGYELNWGANPAYFMLTGNVSALGVPFGTGWIKYTPALHEVWAHAAFNANFLDAFRATGTFDGGIWSLAPLRFNLEAEAKVSVLDLVDIGGEVLVSDNGAAGCVALTSDLGFFAFHLHVGAWVDWDSGSTGVMWSGCDVGRVRDVHVDAGTSRARAAQATAGVTVAPGTGYEVIGVDGAGAAPALTLSGPDGARVDAPATGVANSAKAAILHSATTTFVILRAPAPGRWVIASQPGSAPVTRVQAATSLPAPEVTARVSGHGARRTLTYRVRHIPGQVVRFAERGAGWQHDLGTVRDGKHGTLRFTPAATAGRRDVVAIVEQFGRPRTELTVARFSAPAPPPLTRPRGLRASRHANRLHLRWRPVPGASGYTIHARTSDHRSVATTVASPRFTLLLSRGSSARFTIRAVTARSAGPPTRLNVHTVPH